MNELQQPCEIRLEAISLLASECLTVQEESELRKHLAVCNACRQRFEEIALVCSNVRTAKPHVERESVLAMERCLQHLPLPVKNAAQKNRLAHWRVAMLTTAALVLIGVLGTFAFRRTDHRPVQPTEVVQLPPHVAPVEASDSRLPTLFALRRAAAESDESLNRLLARYSEPSLLEPLNNHLFSQESLR